MYKEVIALIEEGYNVKVIYSFWSAWANAADFVLIEKHPGVFRQVGGDPQKKKYFFSYLG